MGCTDAFSAVSCLFVMLLFQNYLPRDRWITKRGRPRIRRPRTNKVLYAIFLIIHGSASPANIPGEGLVFRSRFAHVHHWAAFYPDPQRGEEPTSVRYRSAIEAATACQVYFSFTSFRPATPRRTRSLPSNSSVRMA